MSTKDFFQILLGLLFPNKYYKKQNNEAENNFYKDIKRVEDILGSQEHSKDEVVRLDEYLSLKLISLSLNFEIQAIPIMGAGEENILKVINIFELYTEAIVKLRKRFPEYFPEWTMMVEKGEIPDHMKKFL